MPSTPISSFPSGPRNRFVCYVLVGDSNGHIGLGAKCAKEVATAIRGGIISAKLNLIPMACWIATNFQNDAPMTENIFPGLFAAAYAYIVWG